MNTISKELEEISIAEKGNKETVKTLAPESVVFEGENIADGSDKEAATTAAPKPLIAEIPQIATRSLQALNQMLTTSFSKKSTVDSKDESVDTAAVEKDKKEPDTSTVDRFGALKAATTAGLGIAANTWQSTVQKAVVAVTPEVDEKYVAFCAEEGTIEGVINARDVSRIPFFVPKNRAISWKIMVKSYDVAVTVKLRVQEMGGSVEQELEQRTILNAGSILFGGRKASDIERHIVIEIDNSYSKLRTKTAAIKVLIGEAAVSALREEELRIEAEVIIAAEKKKAEEEAAEAARLLQEKEKQASQDASDVAGDTASKPAAAAPAVTFEAVRGGLANVWGSIVVGAQAAAAKAVTASEGTALHSHVSSFLGGAAKKTAEAAANSGSLADAEASSTSPESVTSEVSSSSGSDSRPVNVALSPVSGPTSTPVGAGASITSTTTASAASSSDTVMTTSSVSEPLPPVALASLAAQPLPPAPTTTSILESNNDAIHL